MIMVKPPLFNDNMYLWRVLFFRLANMPIGSWYDACKIFEKRNDWYVKCYKCGSHIVRNLGIPLKCNKCGGELRHQDTQHSQYHIKISLE